MPINHSNNSDEDNYLNPLEIEKENIICKDGFCSISKQNDIPKIEKNDTNLFDPI